MYYATIIIVCIKKNYLNKCVINLIFETHVSFGTHHINQYNIIKMKKKNITILVIHFILLGRYT